MNSYQGMQVDDGIGAPSLVWVDLEVSAEVSRVQPRERKAVTVAGQRHRVDRRWHHRRHVLSKFFYSVDKSISVKKDSMSCQKFTQLMNRYQLKKTLKRHRVESVKIQIKKLKSLVARNNALSLALV